MKEIKQYAINNSCYKQAGKRSKNCGILIHDTATPGAMPETFAKTWNVYHPNNQAICVHAFCDNEKVINILPYNYKCWGCGSGAKGNGNDMYIQIEMCIPKDIYFTNGWTYNSKNKEATIKYVKEMIEVVAEWGAMRLKELGISVVDANSVSSHYEACARGIATNHSDPKGLLSLCGLNMDYVRERIRYYLNKGGVSSGQANVNNGASSNNTSTTTSVNCNNSSSVVSCNEIYKVVKANTAIYKDKEGNSIARVISSGAYTIIKKANNRGYLKSGAGWIDLSGMVKVR